jgi:hypothetical protein
LTGSFGKRENRFLRQAREFVVLSRGSTTLTVEPVKEIGAMKALRQVILTVGLVLFSYVFPAIAQGTYTQIDFPGALQTLCLGVDDAGEIVGVYQPPTGPLVGFLLSNGVYTTIAYPGIVDTILTGINDVGQIVGYAEGCSIGFCGFVYYVHTATFADINFPGGDYTFPEGINKFGAIVGYVSIAGQPHGFELMHSKYRQIDLPTGNDTTLTGISASGEVVGYSFTDINNFYVNFSYDRGTFKRLFPKPRPLQVHAINSTGTAIAGQYVQSSSVVAGFANENGTFFL